jgi:hypothetical protein
LDFLLRKKILFKVDDIRKTNELAMGKKAGKVGAGENFSDYLRAGSTTNSNNIQATTAMTSADAIFAAQMVDDEAERQARRETVKKGRKMLEHLEDIRQALLFGEISKDKLIEISRFVKQQDINVNDEKLKEIMQEIELRVEVELAKLMP